VYTPSDTVVNTAVKTMTSLGKIDGPLLTAWNYDAFPLVAAAAKAAHSIEANAIAQALASSSVQAQAHTAMLSRYRFTAASHAPNPAASEFTFISPSRIVNGQFQREQGQ
jgi:branched-chain amino acid transport system substrate-binding protein